MSEAIAAGGLVEFLEDALRPHLPARATPKAPLPGSRADDIRYAAVRLLGRRGFRGAAFASEWVAVLAGLDVVRVVARHACGSRLVIEFTGEEIAGAHDADRYIIDALDGAGCYCVPRESVVPCTVGKRCEA